MMQQKKQEQSTLCISPCSGIMNDMQQIKAGTKGAMYLTL
jgi:hypothetical protein